MLSASVVADFLVFNAKAAGINDMTNLKINKLLYFAQGMYLARYNCPLFLDDIEAWDYGPAIHGIYKQYEEYGNSPIEYHGDKFEFEKFNTNEIDCIMDMLGVYGNKSYGCLIDITHRQDPWKNNYDGSRGKIIPVNEIRDYFVKNNMEFCKTFNKDEFVGYNDQDGHLVLPAELADR